MSHPNLAPSSWKSDNLYDKNCEVTMYLFLVNQNSSKETLTECENEKC